MAYLGIVLNHFRGLRQWAAAHGAEARLDLLSFRLTVKKGAATCVLHPRFINSQQGTQSYSEVLTTSSIGFIGWLPYRPLRWPMSTDKRRFKQFMAQHGLRTPRLWPDASRPPAFDFVVKHAAGSFGRAVFGPYRAGATAVVRKLGRAPESAEHLLEEFVLGRNLKVWCWGERPFHAHLHDLPTVVGDGVSKVETLVVARMGRAGAMLPSDVERDWVVSSLDYQGLELGQVLPEGADAWVDFRYGRRFLADAAQAHSDDALAGLGPALRAQIEAAAQAVHAPLLAEFKLPVLFALDGIVDAEGAIWWLEANSNPMLPATGYDAVLSTMFAADASSPPPPVASSVGFVTEPCVLAA